LEFLFLTPGVREIAVSERSYVPAPRRAQTVMTSPQLSGSGKEIPSPGTYHVHGRNTLAWSTARQLALPASPPRMKERGGSEFVVRCGAWGCPRAAVSIPSAPHCQSGGAAPRSLLDVDGHGACVAVWATLPPGRQATCTAGSGRRAPRFQRDHDCLPTNRSSRDGCVDSTKTCADLYAWPSAGRDASCIMGGVCLAERGGKDFTCLVKKRAERDGFEKQIFLVDTTGGRSTKTTQPTLRPRLRRVYRLSFLYFTRRRKRCKSRREKRDECVVAASDAQGQAALSYRHNLVERAVRTCEKKMRIQIPIRPSGGNAERKQLSRPRCVNQVLQPTNRRA
jgi:hypothetical protein